MEKFLMRENIGEFFSKMHDACKGKEMEVTLRLHQDDADKVVVYNKAMGSFIYVTIVDSTQSIDELVNTLNNE